MISRTGNPRGVTLLEVLITLAIIALFSGVFLLSFDDGKSEELLADAANELKGAALLAKKRSHAFRQDQVISFRGQSVFLEKGRGSVESEPSIETNSPAEPYYVVPPEVSIEIRSYGESRWRPLQEHSWQFRRSGLNEPLEIRLSIGSSHTSLHFNSLTGRAEEETLID